MVPALVKAVVAAVGVSVEVGPGVPCGLDASLPAALKAQGLSADGAEAAAHLEVASSDGGVTLRLFDTAHLLLGHRRLAPEAGDCAVFPKMAALLVKSWVSQKLVHIDDAPPAAVTASTPPGPEALTVIEPASPTPPKPAAVRPVRALRSRAPRAENRAPLAGATPPADSDTPPVVPERQASVSPPVALADPESRAGSTAAAAPVEAARPPAPAVTSTSTEHGVAPRPHGSSALSLAALGGVGLSPGASSVPAVAGVLTWAVWRHVGLSFEAGGRGALVGDAAGGRVSASMQWAGVAARLALSPTASSELGFGAGGHVSRWQAQSSGFLVSGSAMLWTLGLHAFAEWRQTVVGGLFVCARADIRVASRAESFSIEGVGAVVVVSALSSHLGLGAGWVF